MTDLPVETVEEYNYVLHAVWHDDQGHAAHRVIHSTAQGQWNPKALIQEYIRQEHPQWLPEGVGNIGYVEQVRVGEIQVFKVIDCDLEDAFCEWKKEALEARKEVDTRRMREADITTIQALCRKHGFDEPKIDKA
jgi:hypothetical protein